MRALRIAARVPMAVALLLAGLLIEMAVFPLVRPETRRTVIRGWSRALLAACGVRVRTRIAPGATSLQRLAPGRMLVANHRSWLDIFAVLALCPARFVSKAEVRGWPLVGALCKGAGTLFIERHRRHAVHDAIATMAECLRAGDRVAIFPEGTTNDGHAMHRFHANLIQAAVNAGAPLVPVALRYADHRGGHARAVLYVGDITLVDSMLRILGEPRTTVELTVLPEIPVVEGARRHDLAVAAERAVRGALGLADEDVPEGGSPIRAAKRVA